MLRRTTGIESNGYVVRRWEGDLDDTWYGDERRWTVVAAGVKRRVDGGRGGSQVESTKGHKVD